jgi:RNA polymerase sigma factor (sigma-70 family)
MHGVCPRQRVMERARGGDSHAVDALVHTLRPRIVKMAAYYARCTGEDADDLLQEAWLGLLEALPALDLRIGQPEQHLIQRARWRLLDAVRRARVRRCAPLDEVEESRLAEADPEAGLGAACVSEFAGRLKTTQRAVLGGLMAGLTWREVGTALGCTSANVAYHVRQIRRAWEEWENDR